MKAMLTASQYNINDGDDVSRVGPRDSGYTIVDY
jgi:hypothetical protein